MRTVLFYYSKSAHKYPGKGANEFIAEENVPLFQPLSQIKDWRKILSNFYIGEFLFRGLHYRTVEHAFQGTKISLADSTKGRLFSLESGSPLSKGDGEVARKGRKMVILDENLLREWNRMKDSVMNEIMHAKFFQVEEAKNVLLLTNDAELWHGTRGVPKARQHDLESIRNQLVNESRLHDNEVSSNERAVNGRKRKIDEITPC